MRILAVARTYAAPPIFANWEEFGKFLESPTRAGIYEGINDNPLGHPIETTAGGSGGAGNDQSGRYR